MKKKYISGIVTTKNTNNSWVVAVADCNNELG